VYPSIIISFHFLWDITLTTMLFILLDLILMGNVLLLLTGNSVMGLHYILMGEEHQPTNVYY